MGNGMPEDVIVRRARADDAEALVHAHEAGWNATVGKVVGKRLGDLAPLESRIERARDSLANAPDEAAAWVAERNGAVAGMAVTLGVELRDLDVVPEAWGSGVALVDAALERLRMSGAAHAFFWVGEENVRARRFYEREGWTADGERRESALGPPELRYVRPLL
jgi:GNAT superfamily N-acetyltransferase